MEILCSDLMIGNWFSYTNENGTFYLQVEEIRTSGIVTTWNNGEWFVAFDKVKGIPLTEGILLQAGFNRVDNAYQIYWGNSIKNRLTYNVTHATWWIGNKPMYDLKINYLHQLQNIFKSLTQTDLNVKL